MKTRKAIHLQPKAISLSVALCFGCAGFPGLAGAGSTDIPDVPIEMKTLSTPNVLVVLDNSQSMDGYMGGTLVSGNDPNTRGNIGRQEMRNVIGSGTYRTAFNWGLMSFGASSALYNTLVYYMGNNTSMVFTSDCSGYSAGPPQVAGTSASNGGRKCVANPQPFTNGEYVTFARSGDDSDILDVLYTTGSYSSLWGLSAGGTDYDVYGTHKTSSGNSWNSGAFSSSQGRWSFTPTDAGFLPSDAAGITRQLWLPRGWGYYGDITGAGKLNEAVKADSTDHYNNLIALLGNETSDVNSGEIKNSAVFTPIAGTLASARTYFSSSYQSNSSPIAYGCQQNFVMLITDGLPTGKSDGTMYTYDNQNWASFSTCSWSTTNNACTTGTFTKAAQDAIDATKALRTTSKSGVSSTNLDGDGVKSGKFDVQTYVLALGTTVNNPTALSIMNAIAFNGGTGKALLATDQQSFLDSIASIASDITAKTGAAAAAATSTARISGPNNVEYTTQFDSGTWWGDLAASAIDPDTGIASTTPTWSAKTKLDALNSPVTSRKIVTSTDTAGSRGGVQFQPTSATTTTKLSTTQQTLLNTPSVAPVDGASVLAYIRGDQSKETSGTYRVRTSLLGDTVHAEPVVIQGATWYEARYNDAGFAAFKTTTSTRSGMIYQGANDGMLHAFDTSGNEVWAYVPNLVMGNLNNLTKKSGWTHKYYVDSTPAAADVDFGSADSPDWHTILVGGLGKGGNGYYALDVTDPNTVTSEAAAAGKVLWEFPNSISNATTRASVTRNMGYSFGKPVIAKTTAEGWVVLLTSGYNNGTNSGDSGGDGLGHLYVVNPKTGDLIADIPTSGCNATATANPCGLAQIDAYVPNVGGLVVSPIIDYVYGGDLYGNLWRFDLTGNNSNRWSVDKFATLKDGSGAVQPIATKPKLTTLQYMGIGYRMVFVGTGLYMGSTDIPGATGANSYASQTQTVYALIDSLSKTTQTDPHSSTATRTISGNVLSNPPRNCNIPTAWHMDFPGTGERLDSDPAIGLTRVAFNSVTPNSVVCTTGGPSYSYEFDIRAGCAVESTTNTIRTYLGESRSYRPVLVQLSNGKLVEIIRKSDGSIIVKDFAPSTSGSTTGRRVSWRELVTQ